MEKRSILPTIIFSIAATVHSTHAADERFVPKQNPTNPSDHFFASKSATCKETTKLLIQALANRLKATEPITDYNLRHSYFNALTSFCSIVRTSIQEAVRNLETGGDEKEEQYVSAPAHLLDEESMQCACTYAHAIIATIKQEARLFTFAQLRAHPEMELAEIENWEIENSTFLLTYMADLLGDVMEAGYLTVHKRQAPINIIPHLPGAIQLFAPLKIVADPEEIEFYVSSDEEDFAEPSHPVATPRQAAGRRRSDSISTAGVPTPASCVMVHNTTLIKVTQPLTKYDLLPTDEENQDALSTRLAACSVTTPQ